MHFMKVVLEVFVVFLTSTLASPNIHATSDRTLTPVIKTGPRLGDVRVTPRDLFTRQSCETGYDECHGKPSENSLTTLVDSSLTVLPRSLLLNFRHLL